MLNTILEENYSIDQMKLEYAKEISNWTYDEPYSLYSWSNDPEDIAELMDGSYYAVTANDQLIGYFCFGINAQVNAGKRAGLYDNEIALDIGLGIKPALTGKGRGKAFMGAGIAYARQTLNANALRLSVASFNSRAIALYTSIGFSPKGTFINMNQQRTIEFIVMEMES